MATTRQRARLEYGDPLSSWDVQSETAAKAFEKGKLEEVDKIRVSNAMKRAQSSAGKTSPLGGFGSLLGGLALTALTGGLGAGAAAGSSWANAAKTIKALAPIAGAGIGGHLEREAGTKDWDKSLKNVLKNVGGEAGRQGREFLSQTKKDMSGSMLTGLITDMVLGAVMPAKSSFELKGKASEGFFKDIGKIIGPESGKTWKQWKPFEQMKTGGIGFKTASGKRAISDFGQVLKDVVSPTFDVADDSKVAEGISNVLKGLGKEASSAEVAAWIKDKGFLANLLRQQVLTPYVRATARGFQSQFE